MTRSILIFVLFFQGIFSFQVVQAKEMTIENNFDEALLKKGVQFVPPAGFRRSKGHDLEHSFVRDKYSSILVVPPRAISVELFNVVILEEQKDYQYLKFISKEEIKLSDGLCYLVIHSVLPYPRATINWKNVTYHYYKNGKAYSIKFAALETKFDDYWPEFEEALNTFKLIE